MWKELVGLSEKSLSALNERISLKFPADDDKKVVMTSTKPNAFTLSGRIPSFSTIATYEIGPHSVVVACNIRNNGQIDYRTLTLYMDLDEEGNPCFSFQDHKIGLVVAAQFIIGLGLSSSLDVIVNQCLSQADRR